MSSTPPDIPVSANHPLIGPYLKVARAKSHIEDLATQIAAFHSRTPYSVIKEENAISGDLNFKVSIREEIPIGLSTVIGDAIHNLRAAFDLMACEIVALNGGGTTKAQFPVLSTSKEFAAKHQGHIRGASEEAIGVIESLQPYHGGRNQAIWTLHQLDIRDKHRMIIPVGAAHGGVDPGFQKGFQAMFAEIGITEDIPDIGSVFLNPANRQFPLKDGAIVYTILGTSRGSIGEDDVEVKIDIAFAEGEVVDGQPIISTLYDLLQFTADALEIIRERLFT